MPGRSKLLVLAATLIFAGCYHQVVRTDATPGTVVLERPWTATYLFGLVPAATINTASQCPAGVAIVETSQSFLNGLVGGLTLGIYTPQTVKITCAAGGAALSPHHRLHWPEGADELARAAAMEDAIRLARRTGEPVLLDSTR